MALTAWAGSRDGLLEKKRQTISGFVVLGVESTVAGAVIVQAGLDLLLSGWAGVRV